MADRLVRSQQRTLEVEAARRDLITVISHDLRTPLASLRAMVEAIDEGVVEDLPSLRRYAAEMRASVAQLTSMIDDLFELAQLDAGVIGVGDGACPSRGCGRVGNGDGEPSGAREGAFPHGRARRCG